MVPVRWPPVAHAAPRCSNRHSCGNRGVRGTWSASPADPDRDHDGARPRHRSTNATTTGSSGPSGSQPRGSSALRSAWTTGAVRFPCLSVCGASVRTNSCNANARSITACCVAMLTFFLCDRPVPLCLPCCRKRCCGNTAKRGEPSREGHEAARASHLGLSRSLFLDSGGLGFPGVQES